MMMRKRPPLFLAGQLLSLTLAASFALSLSPVALAGVGDVNSTNDGPNVSGGAYYNTPGQSTTFVNSAGSGLYLKAGDLVTGKEVGNAANPTGSLTGNGGSLYFNAPGQVVRLDGNIDVSGIINGGNVRIDSGALIQNGQIYANGGANAGMVQFNVLGMTMGPNALIQARGGDNGGAGGVVNINAKDRVDIAQGAVIDTSGAVIGTYNTNVINVSGGLVNLNGILMANGLNPGQQGGKVSITATDSVKIGATGEVAANGADGLSGPNPGNGGKGGEVVIAAARNIDNAGVISANGRNGGANPTVATNVDALGRPMYLDENNNVVYESTDGYGKTSYVDANGNAAACENLRPYAKGQDGGHGADGGNIFISYKGDMTNTGAIEAKGGDGGHGQQALVKMEACDLPLNGVAIGGNGGNGGNGGYVEIRGNNFSDQAYNHINVNGGSGGHGATANIANNCGCSTPGIAGQSGACGAPGKIVVIPHQDTPPPVTPPNTPQTPLQPPYPREYPRLGDALSPRNPQVLSYNRSIFLARSPVPVIQKKTPPPPPPARVMMVKPKPAPKPPQKKATVRGYW